jgi:nucleoporin NUP42
LTTKYGKDGNLIYNVSAANISQDLNPKGEKPMWPLSSYAPFKHETTLIGGLDMSPEELRVKAAAAVTAGNVNEYVRLQYYLLGYIH